MILFAQQMLVAAVDDLEVLAGEIINYPGKADELFRPRHIASPEKGIGEAQAAVAADRIAPAEPGGDGQVRHIRQHRRLGAGLQAALARPIRVLCDEGRNIGERDVIIGPRVVHPAQHPRTEEIICACGDAVGGGPAPGPSFLKSALVENGIAAR